MKRNYKGFTLTELLAVVIILSILAVIAAGTYKKAVERSRFSDGLTMASTVMEAVNRYFYDTQVQRPTKDKLDVSFANQQECTANPTYCYKTKYFETTIYTGYTDAKRASGLYTVRVYSTAFGSNTRKDPVCVTTSDEGKNFCGSVGYTSCTGTGTFVCSKP